MELISKQLFAHTQIVKVNKMLNKSVLGQIDDVIKEFDETFNMTQHNHLRFLLKQLRDSYVEDLVECDN